MGRFLFIAALVTCLSDSLGAAQGSNGVFTITSAPKFEQRGELECFIVSDEVHTFRLWGHGRQRPLPGAVLDTNKVYEFVFTYRPLDKMVPLELLRVNYNGRMIYDVEFCEVHRIKMGHKIVPMIYGLVRPGPDAPPTDAEFELFPHRFEVAFGGCTPGPEKTAEIHVCSQCKAAFERWKQDSKNRNK